MFTDYFGTWKFYKRCLLIAIPVMLQSLVQSLVSLVDNFMVAGLGDIKMSGVNVMGQISFVFFIFINTLCSSGGIFMSQFCGAKDKNGMAQTFRFKIILCGIFGVICALICFLAPRTLFGLMVPGNSDASLILDQSQIYSRAIAFSWILTGFSTAMASSLREIENVKAPLVISISATLINTFFNFVLIYGNLGAPRLEAAGAGYATFIARFAEFCIFTIYLLKKRPDFLFNIFKLFNIDFKLFSFILKKSCLILASEMMWAVSETVSSALFNSLGGAEVVSGMSGGFSIMNLFLICTGGIVTASSVIMGQELGAGKLNQAKKYKAWILHGSVIFGFLFMFAGFISVLLVPVVYKNLSVQAQSISRQIIVVSGFYIPVWCLINAQYAVSRSGGDTKMGAVCDFIANIAYIGIMILMVTFTSFIPGVIFAAAKISDIIKTAIAHFWLKKERWLVNLTESAE